MTGRFGSKVVGCAFHMLVDAEGDGHAPRGV